MLNRSIEETHLLQARSHVAAAVARIANQSLVIGRLRACGLDTRQAETCLRTMQHTLGVLRAHQELIERMLQSLAAPGSKGLGPAKRVT